MNQLTGILVLLMATALSGSATVIFSSFGEGGLTAASVSITDGIVNVQVSSAELQSDVDLSITALLGSQGTLVFSPIAYSHNTLPSPPFSLGGIDFPALPSRSIFRERFTITQIEADRLSALSFVTLSLPSGGSANQLRLSRSIPEPSSLVLCSLVGFTFWGRRR